jgi:hypothetical protein
VSCLLVAALTVALPHGCDLLQGNGPMVLYGRLIDQMGNPVPDAPLVFTASGEARFQLPRVLAPSYSGGERTWLVHATTSKNGTFFVNAGWGRALSPGKAGDLGYFNALAPGPFRYGRTPPAHNFHGDLTDSVVFMHWNEGFRRIISHLITARVGHEVNTVSYRLDRISPYGSNDDNFNFRIVRSDGRSQRPYGWSIEIDKMYPQALEILRSDGAIGSQAPAEGYGHELTFMMKPNEPHWSTQMTGQFYTRSNDRTIYAGVEITAKLGENGQDATVTIRYTANFGSSRDLVPGPIERPAK